MVRSKDRRHYRSVGRLLVRATAHAALPLPDCPDPDGDIEHCLRWLKEVWEFDAVADAVRQASPDLAGRLDALGDMVAPGRRQTRRLVLSLLRYLIRLRHRPTPFGLFAGVAAAEFGPALVVGWDEHHRPVLRAAASAVARAIRQLEVDPAVLARLSLVSNDLAFVRGARLVVPRRPRVGEPAVGQESLRYGGALQLVVCATQTPASFAELTGMLAAEFPAASRSMIETFVMSLVRHGVLISNLNAPSTVVDPLGHVRRVLGDDAGQVSTVLAAEPGQVWPDRPPTAADLVLDCSLVLPESVQREAESAVSVLARLSPMPFGTGAWRQYHNRFFERYGIGALVPLRDVVDPDVGLGFPHGYLGAAPAVPPPVSERDRRLLDLAQAAALEGRSEVVLDERLIEELAVGDSQSAVLPPHLELRFRLHTAGREELDAGDFTLDVLSCSRGIGTTTGRFIEVLDAPGRDRLASLFQTLPAGDPDALPVQLSFPPLDPGDAHVARAPQLLPHVIAWRSTARTERA